MADDVSQELTPKPTWMLAKIVAIDGLCFLVFMTLEVRVISVVKLADQPHMISPQSVSRPEKCDTGETYNFRY